MIKRLKHSSILFALLACWAVSVSVAATVPALAPAPEHSLSSVLITKFIDKMHYKRTQLGDAESQAILAQYIDTLDPNRLFFTRQDIASFERYQTLLDDALLKGDMRPAFAIFERFRERRIERAEFALQQLEKDFDFDVNERYQFDRSDVPWAEDTAELDELWRKRVKNDVLSLGLAGKSDEELTKTLRGRYERLKTRSHQFHAEDTYAFFVNAFLSQVEPHTAYFSPRASENFDINMSLSLEGIGAVLQTVDEHTVVRRVIPGGPADLSGRLHAEDRIVAVAQGRDGELVDVVGWRLDDVVDLIRGPKGSVVQLGVLPKASGLAGPSETITIVRNKIKLEEQQAKKSIIELNDGDASRRIGVITIPTFYMDFAAAQRGDKDYRSTTRDTRVLIEQLLAEGVDGIVIDLRGNGGGSLAESISLTGLFIESGPVVQVKESSGELRMYRDDDKAVAYAGPLAVLVDRHSASASEIFAAAIQDYRRGIVIGEPTFGKGTVQTVIDLNRYIDTDATLGRLKLTMAQFFRINGDSTQHRGVIPDIVFPTADASDEAGESALEHALPWAQIEAAEFRPQGTAGTALDQVRRQHLARIEQSEGFAYLLAQATLGRQNADKDMVSLLKSERQREREALESARREQENRFRKAVGLELLAEGDEEAADEKLVPEDDPFAEAVEKIELEESAAILLDIIKLQPSGAASLVTQRTVQ